MKQLKTALALFGLLCIFILNGCGGGGGSSSGSSPSAGLSSNKAITSFALNGVLGVIIGTNIGVTVPYGTDITALVATFQTTGKSVAVGSRIQSSGLTPTNYTTPVVYTVTAADSTTQNYTVTVTIAPIGANSITSFSLNGTIGVITGTSIAVTVPYSTDVTALVATFHATGQTVTVGTTIQISGTTPDNFTSPVVYTVTAADGTTQNYTVTVTVAPIDAKTITSFSLNGVIGTINGTSIAVMMPYGTNVTALIATFNTTGQRVTVGTTVQSSGSTPNNFSSSVVYTVIAADGTTQNYTVTVTTSSDDANAITFFSLNGITGTISGTSIAVTMPEGTNVTGLVATYHTTGQKVIVGNIDQINTHTPNNFTSPVVYTVIAANGARQNYTVIVTVPAPAGSVKLTIINNSGYPMSADLISSAGDDNPTCEGKVYNFATGTWTPFIHDANVIDLPTGQTALFINPSCLKGGARFVVAKGSKNENFNANMTAPNSGAPDLAKYTNIYDKIEMGYPTGSTGAATWNLTAVDFFGIPFQMTDGHTIVGINSGETRSSVNAKLSAAYNTNPGMYGNRFFGPNGDRNNFARIFSPQHFYTDIGNQWDSSINANLDTLISEPNFNFQYAGFTYTNLSKPSPNTLRATCSDLTGSYICNLTGITTGNAIAGEVQYSTTAGSPAIAANFAGMIATVINRGVLANSLHWGSASGGDDYYKYWFQTGPYNEYEAALLSVAIDHKIYATSYEDFWHMENGLQIGPANNSVTVTILPFD